MGSTATALIAIVVYCGLAVLVGEFAQRKGHSAWGFSALSILISPIFGLVIALLVEDKAAVKKVEVAGSNATSDLARLGDLKKRGLLTDEEFHSAKRRVLQQDPS